VGARRLQQDEGAHQVGLDERRRPVDRAVDMALGREMHHRVRLMLGEGRPHRPGIDDVRPQQRVPGMPGRFLERLLGGGVGHLVEVDHVVAGAAHDMPDDGRADEPAAAGQKNFHRAFNGRVVFGGRRIVSILPLRAVVLHRRHSSGAGGYIARADRIRPQLQVRHHLRGGGGIAPAGGQRQNQRGREPERVANGHPRPPSMVRIVPDV
jgi:hypothetical protein